MMRTHFISQGYDPVKQQTFIGQWEAVLTLVKPAVTLCNRNFKKNQAELTNIRHLGCLENLFTLTVSRVTKSFWFINVIC